MHAMQPCMHLRTLRQGNRHVPLRVREIRCVAPRHDAVLADEVELVVPDRRVARVPRDHDTYTSPERIHA